MIGCDKKGNLQQQRQHTLQGIEGLIIVLPVIGLEHHKPLVAGEGLFDVLDPAGHLLLGVPFLVLDGVGPAIQGQEQHVHGEAQHKNTNAAVGKQKL